MTKHYQHNETVRLKCIKTITIGTTGDVYDKSRYLWLNDVWREVTLRPDELLECDAYVTKRPDLDGQDVTFDFTRTEFGGGMVFSIDPSMSDFSEHFEIVE